MMKKRISTVIAVLVLACFLAELASTMIKSTGLDRVKWESLVGRKGFYFAKRQWVADLRTLVAAFRYLCASHPVSSSPPLSMVQAPASSPLPDEISTNLLSTNLTAASMPMPGKRLSRAERMLGRYRRSSFGQQPAVSAFADLLHPACLGSNAPVWL
jgi:hypothetical protein